MPWLTPRGRHPSATVVTDLDLQRCRSERNGHLDPVGAGVTTDVGQRLLDDPVGSLVDAVREGTGASGLEVRHLDARPLRRTDEPLQVTQGRHLQIGG